MKDLDAFLPDIMQYAPGCAIPSAYFGIRKAAIEFCERTRLWRYEDDFDVSLDGCDAILAPAGAVVHEIESATFDGQPLTQQTTAWLDQRERGWREGLLTGAPRYLTQIMPDTLRLVPVQAGHLRLYLWLKPADDADQLPDFMADQHRETIARGALGRILLMPNQSFTNAELGSAFFASFQQKLDSLSTKGSSGQQRATTRTRSSPF
ncbi:MAG TPA: hypothetical protein VL051_09555 [Burkholderiaceae bacterium]|nr:hypothetical protein [Burkholderiaceae bacterium]